MWITFKRLAPKGEVMDKIRGMIDDRKQEFMKIHELYKSQNTFTMEGRKYKRIMNKELPEDLTDWYQRKELFFVCDRNDDLIFSMELIDVMYKDFKLIEPIYHYLMGLT